MARHIDTGKRGEQLGSEYLAKTGYSVIEQNWRYSHWEVDVIAVKDNILHFIEIKTRSTKKFGLPEDKVGKKKMDNLVNAAEQYLYLNPEWKRIQFNILSIMVIKKTPVEYFLLEDVYL